MKEKILKLIKSIEPVDSLEFEHILDAIEWIDSGEEIFRIEKPAMPPKHLVSYFVLVDLDKEKIMLVDHIKAGLMLPAGGHIEKDEHPTAAVQREMEEELRLSARFIKDNPVFITQTITVGETAGHTDVSLWYLVHGNSREVIKYDRREFNGYKWFDFNEILNIDVSELDPHMHRFIKKLMSILRNS